MIECLRWRKAFGSGADLEKHQSGNTASPKALATEMGWEANGKLQGLAICKTKTCTESQMSPS